MRCAATERSSLGLKSSAMTILRGSSRPTSMKKRPPTRSSIRLRCDPICAVALGRADALHCRRTHRDRLQRRRALYPPNRAEPQERTVCWLGWRRRTLGRHRLTDRNLQAHRRRTTSLSRRPDHPHRQRPPEQPDRRTATLGLSQYPRTPARGLRTSLTMQRSPDSICDSLHFVPKHATSEMRKEHRV